MRWNAEWRMRNAERSGTVVSTGGPRREHRCTPVTTPIDRSMSVAALIAPCIDRSTAVVELIAGPIDRSLTVAVLTAAGLLMCVSPGRTMAQTYEVEWYTVDGGGAMFASGGTYKVGGTAGQPDAGILSGGAYSVRGGFWGVAPACPAPDPLLAEPTVPDVGSGTRVRYLSFTGGTAGAQEGIRVTFAIMPADPPDYDFTYANGRQMWVGEPREVTEASGSSGSTPPPTFWVAELQCDPHFTDWSTYDGVHVYGQSIVPGAMYDLQLVTMGCEVSEAGFSAALSVDMSRWGDTVGADNPASPQGVVDFNDISSIVDKFRNVPDAPAKSRADVAGPSGGVPDRIIDFVDIPAVVDAFRGLPYPYAGPPVIDPCG